MINAYYNTGDFTLYKGDSLELLNHIDTKVDMIFADPPYFLSTGNGKVNINGQYIKFDKGQWDRVRTRNEVDAFNFKWIASCSKILKESGTIWICGTYHNIFSVEKCLDQLGFKIINLIVWQKTDPPMTLSDKRLNFCAEYIIWAVRKCCKEYTFNKETLKKINGGTLMQDVWKLPAAGVWEKKCGKHPTQKPLRLLYRIILASTQKGDTILDPFAGSSTTGIASNLLGRKFIGCEMSEDFLQLSIRRKQQIADASIFTKMLRTMEENPEEVMVLVNHARQELKAQMIKTGICYTRIGETKGSLLVTNGFERMQYILLHTNGFNTHLFRLKSKGTFQIWTKETLIKHGFLPVTSPYYAVFLFDNSQEIPFPKDSTLHQKINSYRARIRPLIDFF